MTSTTKEIETYLKENYHVMYRLAFSYVKNSQDAQDIVQDVIYKSLTNHKSLKTTAIRTWIYRIVVNTSIDYLRKKKKIILVENNQFEKSSTNDHYHNLDIEMALNNLSPKLKTVIVLRFFEELSLNEIAEVLDENINTVKTRLYDALKKLKIDISKEDVI